MKGDDDSRYLSLAASREEEFSSRQDSFTFNVKCIERGAKLTRFFSRSICDRRYLPGLGEGRGQKQSKTQTQKRKPYRTTAGSCARFGAGWNGWNGGHRNEEQNHAQYPSHSSPVRWMTNQTLPPLLSTTSSRMPIVLAAHWGLISTLQPVLSMQLHSSVQA